MEQASSYQEWVKVQLQQVADRFPGSEPWELQVVLETYQEWLVEMQRVEFKPGVRLSPVDYSVRNKGNGSLSAQHRITGLEAVGKSEPEARQALERQVGNHLREWRKREEAMVWLKSTVMQMVTEVYMG